MLYILHTVCLRYACSDDNDGLYIGFKIKVEILLIFQYRFNAILN